MERVVVIGGGPGGCGAALTAAKASVQVVLLERTDSLSGLSPWCGQLMGWGPRHESRLMGGGDYFNVWESLEINRKSDFSIPDGNILWDVTQVEQATARAMEAAGVKVMLQAQAVDVEMEGNRVTAVVLANGDRVAGDAFVDATGATGGVALCTRHGQGCALCCLKCTVFGDRASISEKAGVPDLPGTPRYLTMNFVALESLAPWKRREIEETPGGYSYHPIPEAFFTSDFTNDWPYPQRPIKARWQDEDLEVVNVRFAKTRLLVPLSYMRQVPGFENAWPAMPMTTAGMAVGASSPAPREDTMRVKGLDNLFAAGSRAGNYSSAVPAIFTGELAGHNAARKVLGRGLLVLPKSTIQGFFISMVNRGKTPTEWPRTHKAEPIFDEHGFDIPRLTDFQRIKESIQESGLTSVYERKLA
ncbi:MAG: FAD-dependent oxidoreductase [Chloroflexi bacterium]|nr:FAD-dependent oxidoreductase [Chloroflexota bacterium]